MIRPDDITFVPAHGRGGRHYPALFPRPGDPLLPRPGLRVTGCTRLSRRPPPSPPACGYAPRRTCCTSSRSRRLGRVLGGASPAPEGTGQWPAMGIRDVRTAAHGRAGSTPRRRSRRARRWSRAARAPAGGGGRHAAPPARSRGRRGDRGCGARGTWPAPPTDGGRSARAPSRPATGRRPPPSARCASPRRQAQPARDAPRDRPSPATQRRPVVGERSARGRRARRAARARPGRWGCRACLGALDRAGEPAQQRDQREHVGPVVGEHAGQRGGVPAAEELEVEGGNQRARHVVARAPDPAPRARGCSAGSPRSGGPDPPGRIEKIDVTRAGAGQRRRASTKRVSSERHVEAGAVERHDRAGTLEQRAPAPPAARAPRRGRA